MDRQRQIDSRWSGFWALLLGVLVVSCQTSITLNTSPPGTRVLVGNTTIGVTPITLDASKLAKVEAGGHLIRLERDGYKNLWIWVPAGIRGLDLALNLEAFRVSEAEARMIVNESASRDELYELSWDLLRAQTAIFLKAESSPDLEKLLASYGSLGVVRYLSALEQLRKGDGERALAELEAAVALAPKEPDFLALLNELRSKSPKAQGK